MKSDVTRRSLLAKAGFASISALGGGLSTSEVSASEAGEVLWSAGDESWASTPPTVVDGVAYVDHEGGEDVVAVDIKDGSTIWTSNINEDSHGTPSGSDFHSNVVVDGYLLFSGTHGAAHMMDAETGEELWEYEGGYLPPVVMADGVVYIGGSNLFAVDAADGELLWKYETTKSVTTTPVIVDGTVYISTYDGIVSAIDTETQEEIWRSEVPERAAKVTVANNRVYCISMHETEYNYNIGQSLYAFDIENGEELWRYDEGYSIGRAAVADDKVFTRVLFKQPEDTREDRMPIEDAKGEIHAIDAETGEKEWSNQREGRRISSTTVADDVVFFGEGRVKEPTSPETDTGFLVAVDSETGETLWKTELGDQAHEPIVVDGVAYVSTSEGVVAVDAGVEGSSTDSLKRHATHGHHDSYAEKHAGTIDSEGLPGFGFLGGAAALLGGAVWRRSRSSGESRSS